ncbi:hypothetical protein CLV51_102794 [Chitinophaga niastensis]|uniref:Uncharacterized protein n=1 Tax=Chitinophaga niastensis TaxID=536980 RepID=A0A2P8HNY7_CHINA|nr:hypothetical protein [Chitinophaga niastensis]PSL47934.1 hypothetical protein CLV51_102794 [Chitinophaga niastensis]
MNPSAKIFPKPVVRAIAGGMLLMALFTSMWAGITTGGFEGRDHHLVLIIFAVPCLIMIGYGSYLFVISKRFPDVVTAADKQKGKRISKWYGIIFGAEGVAIPIVLIPLYLSGQERFAIPAVALIVGLHFYPMGVIFERKIDYYVATWACLFALGGIIMTLLHTISDAGVLIFVGLGLGTTTTFYGMYLVYLGYHLARPEHNPTLP